MIVPTLVDVAPFLAVLGGGLLLPAVLDVLLKPVRVPLYWAMPLAIGAAGLVGLAFVAPQRAVEPGLARVLYRANLLAMVAGATSAATLVELLLLCGARTLRPEGDLGEARSELFRVVGGACVLAGLVGIWLPEALYTVPFAAAALVWLLTLGRGGSPRVEAAAPVGADAWLFAVATGGIVALAVPVASAAWATAAGWAVVLGAGVAFGWAFAPRWTWRSWLVLGLLPVGVVAPWA